MKTFERVENEEIGRYTPNGGVILTVLNSIALWKKRMTIEKKRNVKGSFAHRCLCLLTESHRSGKRGNAGECTKYFSTVLTLLDLFHSLDRFIRVFLCRERQFGLFFANFGHPLFHVLTNCLFNHIEFW